MLALQILMGYNYYKVYKNAVPFLIHIYVDLFPCTRQDENC